MNYFEVPRPSEENLFSVATDDKSQELPDPSGSTNVEAVQPISQEVAPSSEAPIELGVPSSGSIDPVTKESDGESNKSTGMVNEDAVDAILKGGSQNSHHDLARFFLEQEGAK